MGIVLFGILCGFAVYCFYKFCECTRAQNRNKAKDLPNAVVADLQNKDSPGMD